MSPEADPDAGPGTEREQAARRRRLAEVFGDVLPEQTRDDAGDPADRGVTDSNEDWLRRQVPPHHG
ncbi:hypothetical protein GCM10027596_07050 [Nocardioides korecus]